jgi:probable HAF family extracellular repeat protein
MAGLGAWPGVGACASADGSVIVASRFYWTSTAGVAAFPSSADGLFVGDAVSADGSTFAGAWFSGKDMVAARWSATNGVSPLTDLPGWSTGSQSSDVSADGNVIVGSGEPTDTDREAFRWTPETGLVGLGYLPGGKPRSAALAVSADGAVVVGAADSPRSPYLFGGHEAFRWTQTDGMVGLGFLRPGDWSSVASDTSGDGSVVVGASYGPSGEAFIWDQAHGMRSLKDVLTNLGLDLSGWTLSEARAISDDGLTIAGIGYLQGGAGQGWVAHIPEPATGTLLICGAWFLHRRSRA